MWWDIFGRKMLTLLYYLVMILSNRLYIYDKKFINVTFSDWTNLTIFNRGVRLMNVIPNLLSPKLLVTNS